MLAPSVEALAPYDCLYVSPHADDVAFSCAGRLLADQGRGLRTVVLGLFEGAGGESRPARDVAGALARVGADYVVAGLPAAGRRDPFDASHRALADRRLPEDEAMLDQASRILSEAALRTRARHVYAPLGVGGHVDHRLAHDAGLRVFAGKPGLNVFFYEERPEAFVPGAVRVRLGNLGARLPPAAHRSAERAGLARYVFRFPLAPALRGDFRGWTDRLRTAACAARQWRQARGWNPQKAFGPRFQPVVPAASAEAIPALREILLALAPPGARTARFAERFSRLSAAYSRRLGAAPHGERYWLLLPDDAYVLPAAVGQE